MTLTRRELLQAGSVAAMSAGLGGGLAIRADAADRHTELRRRLVRKPRGLIFNSDPDALLAPMANTPDGYIAARFAALVGTQFASISDCTGQTTIFEHRAPKGEWMNKFVYGGVYDDARDAAVSSHPDGRAWRDNMTALAEHGTDMLELGGRFARRHRLEHLWAYRVNDVHDSFLAFEYSLWKRTNPHLLLADASTTGDENDPRYWWTALDFGRDVVRERLLRLVSATVKAYRLDGLDLDYYRAPLFFKPHMDAEPATSRQRGLLTGWQRRMRALTFRVGNERRRPLLLGTRVPATIERCRHVGIDIEEWLARGLVDLLRLGGGYMPFTEPVRELIALAHHHGVPVHVTLSRSGLRDRLGTPEAWRGAAANVWHAGADGIYMFNAFIDDFPVEPNPLHKQLGSPRTLARRDKRFAIESEQVLQGLTINAIEQRQALPMVVPGRCVLPVGDDIGGAARKGVLERAVLTVAVSDAPAADRLVLRVNGERVPVRRTDPDAGEAVFVPPARLWRHGAEHPRLRHGCARPAAGRARGVGRQLPLASAVVQAASDIPMALGEPQSPRGGRTGWWTRYYRLVFRRHGIRFGAGLRVLGPVHLQIDGKGSNITMGRNVTLMPGAHLKNRENGRIVLHDGVKLDSVTRLVAANDATIELGENAAVGLGTVINAGADVRIGRYALIAAHCVMSASDHGFAAGTFIREQPYTYDEIRIGEDVWLGAHTFVSKGARVGDGAVVSAGSFVVGEIPAGAVARGRPVEVVKFRE